MIHLDTNFLVELVTVGSDGARQVREWLVAGREVGASAIAWSEFCNGPLTREQKEAAFAVLKPGGVLGVEEHRAPAGRSIEWIVKNGYVTEDLLIERARAAGLVLDARSEVNANPRDTRDHPHGVWSLPPTLRGGEVDRDRFLSIGESDRFTHRYLKT